MSQLDTLKASKIKPHPVVNTVVLAKVWKLGMVDHMPGYVRDLTVKEAGQMKHFLTYVGAARAVPVLKWALDSWAHFTAEARAAKGLPGQMPVVPMVGFLLEHHDVLLNIVPAYVSSHAPADSVEQDRLHMIYINVVNAIVEATDECTSSPAVTAEGQGLIRALFAAEALIDEAGSALKPLAE
jgi:hypothetical protein